MTRSPEKKEGQGQVFILDAEEAEKEERILSNTCLKEKIRNRFLTGEKKKDIFYL